MLNKETIAMSEGTKTDQNSDIKIDTEVLNERRETYTSLSDLYEIVVFTNQSFVRSEQLRANSLAEELLLLESVFIKTFEVEENQDLQSLLFVDRITETKLQEYTSADKNNKWIYTIVLLLVSFIFCILLVQYNKYRKQRRQDDVNDLDLDTTQKAKD